jgi:hypothetical protein
MGSLDLQRRVLSGSSEGRVATASSPSSASMVSRQNTFPKILYAEHIVRLNGETTRPSNHKYYYDDDNDNDNDMKYEAPMLTPNKKLGFLVI